MTAFFFTLLYNYVNLTLNKAKKALDNEKFGQKLSHI